jgi:hypothetical protein
MNDGLERDLDALKQRWGTDTASEALRRAVRLAVVVSDPSVDEVHVVREGQRQSLLTH